MTTNYKKLALAAAQAAADKKADQIELLDIRASSDVADFLLIAGANSSAQMKAIQESVEERLLEEGVAPVRRDGKAKDRWMAIDFGGLVVHILLPEAREFYRLEQLWEKQKPVKWEKPSRKSAS